MTGRRVAITGATGFLGRHIVRVFLDAGWTVRVLSRRDPAAIAGPAGEIEAVIGDLGDTGALLTLCADSDVIIHAAGLIKARRASDFFRVNEGGAASLGGAALAAAPGSHVIIVSSLAARQPNLSSYAASKRAGEAAMQGLLGARLSVVRPTAIYGPGDQETFQFIAAAAKGWPLPLLGDKARITMVHAADVACDLLARAERPPAAGAEAICDSRPDGYSWRELMSVVASSIGRKPKLLRIPGVTLRLVGWASDAARIAGASTIASSGKMRELLHADWSVGETERSRSGYVPRFTLEQGLADTVAWANREGLLPRDSRMKDM
jgi:nucleoside-diphosphate-sugar epimerase